MVNEEVGQKQMSEAEVADWSQRVYSSLGVPSHYLRPDPEKATELDARLAASPVVARLFGKARAEGKSEEPTPFVDTWNPYADVVYGEIRGTCCPAHKEDLSKHSPPCRFDPASPGDK